MSVGEPDTLWAPGTFTRSVGRIDSTTGSAFVKRYHYSHGIHNGPMCYGLRDDTDGLVGVCAFATPNSENVRASVFGAEHVDRVTELHRLVLLDDEPKNSESWFVARALRALHADRPHLWAVVSFADATEGHVGTIYQALNAVYYGESGQATFWRDRGGRLRHPRQAGHNVSDAEAERMGWTPEVRAGKHRYLFLLPPSRAFRRRLLTRLNVTPMPYPRKVLTVEPTTAILDL